MSERSAASAHRRGEPRRRAHARSRVLAVKSRRNLQIRSALSCETRISEPERDAHLGVLQRGLDIACAAVELQREA